MFGHDNLPGFSAGCPDDERKAWQYRAAWVHSKLMEHWEIIDAVNDLANTLRMWADIWTEHADPKRAHELTSKALKAFWATPVEDDYYSEDKVINHYMAIVASYTDAAWCVKNRGAYANEIARDLIKFVDKEAN